VVSLVPSGFYQFYFAVRDGMWCERSSEIASGEVLRTLAKLRTVPDLIFAAGAVLLLVFVVRAEVLTVRKPKEVLAHESAASARSELPAASRAG
jgi:nitric oxide reductase subunit B